MDWAFVLAMFLIGLLQDTGYSLVTACISHDHPWWASVADFCAMLVNKGGVYLMGIVAVTVATQGDSSLGPVVIVVGAVGGALGTRLGAYLSALIERRFGRVVPHPMRATYLYLPDYAQHAHRAHEVK